MRDNADPDGDHMHLQHDQHCFVIQVEQEARIVLKVGLLSHTFAVQKSRVVQAAACGCGDDVKDNAVLPHVQEQTKLGHTAARCNQGQQEIVQLSQAQHTGEKNQYYAAHNVVHLCGARSALFHFLGAALLSHTILQDTRRLECGRPH